MPVSAADPSALGFINDLLDHLIWPGVAGGALYGFRQEVRDFITRLRKGKVGPDGVQVEADPSKELEGAAESAAELPRTTEPPDTPVNTEPSDLQSALATLRNVLDATAPASAIAIEAANLSARDVIVTGWINLETVFYEYVQALEPGYVGHSMPVAKKLVITWTPAITGVSSALEAMDGLRRTRNLAVHDANARFTADDLAQFRETAAVLAGFWTGLSRDAQYFRDGTWRQRFERGVDDE